MFWGAHCLLILTLLGKASYHLFFVQFCFLRTWCGFLPAQSLQIDSSCTCRQLNHQVRKPQIWPARNTYCTPCVVRILLSVLTALMVMLRLSFFLSILGSGFGSWEGNIYFICLRKTLSWFIESFSSVSNIYYMYLLKTDKIFGRNFFLSLFLFFPLFSFYPPPPPSLPLPPFSFPPSSSFFIVLCS